MLEKKGMRLFLAVPLPLPVRNALNHWTSELKKVWGFDRWIHPVDYHLTLHFLGECTFKQGMQIKKLLAVEAAEYQPFQLEISGIGVFGEPSSPRVLWTGVKGDLVALHQLQNGIISTLDAAGITDREERKERGYQPHITLARNFSGQNFPYEELDHVYAPREGALPFKVREIVLYQTHPRRNPKYQPLATFMMDLNS